VRVNPTATAGAVKATPVNAVSPPTSSGKTVRARPVSVAVPPSSSKSSLGYDLDPVVDTRVKPIPGRSYATVIGSSARQGLVGQPLKIEILTKNVLANQIQVLVSDQFNKTFGARITDNGDSTFTCAFVPSLSGRYSIDIILDDNPIGGSPVAFVALDVPDTAPTTTSTTAPRRELNRASTAQTKEPPGGGGPVNLSKSKETDEAKTQKESGKTRKERAPAGSQTHREAVSAEKPRKKKKPTTSERSAPARRSTTTATSTTKPKSPSSSKKTGTTSTTVKKKTPAKKKPVEEEGSGEQIQEEPEDPRDDD